MELVIVSSAMDIDADTIMCVTTENVSICVVNLSKITNVKVTWSRELSHNVLRTLCAGA